LYLADHPAALQTHLHERALLILRLELGICLLDDGVEVDMLVALLQTLLENTWQNFKFGFGKVFFSSRFNKFEFVSSFFDHFLIK
jgi:hypothetical protein